MSNGSRIHHVYHRGFPLPADARISTFHKLIRGRFGVVAFILLSVMMTILPALVYSWPTFIFLVTGLVSRDRCRRFLNWSFGVWLYMESYFQDKILGTSIRVFGHSRKFSDKCLIIMNHRCHLDWMFFFPVICKQGDPKKLMALLKNNFKLFPILGWAMQLRNFIFLTKNWSIDKIELKRKLKYLKLTNSNYQILMFPEGTELTERSSARSDKFAKENNYPSLEYLIHPRTTGFKYVLKSLRKYQIDTVYDVTVAFPDIFVATAKELVMEGRIPREIHYHICSFDASSLPKTDDELDEWVGERWREKEERLRLFYAHRKFLELPSNITADSNGLKAVNVQSPEVHSDLHLSSTLHALAFCIVNLFLIAYLCWCYWFVATLVVLYLLGSVYISVYTHGADHMIMNGLNSEELRELLVTR